MIKSLISDLQKLVDNGEIYITAKDLLGLAYSDTLVNEWEAREKMIRNIIRAKREAGFPLKSVFFEDVWPVVLKAYLEKMETMD